MNRIVLGICITIALTAIESDAQDQVDVYFITGQSNAGNVGEMNSYDVQGYNGYNAADFDQQQSFGFDLTFARIRDRTSGGTVTEVVEAFSFETLVDPVNYAVDNIAVQLNAEFGNDIGIFSYGRNGRPLANTSEESWFPGTVANPYNDELYGNFQTWSQDRLDEIEAGPDGIAGTADDRVAIVKGIFWFQGESDSGDAASIAAYQTNFENLIARFRADFNDPELPIVASEIREINANDASINQSLHAVAANDDFVSVIDISDASVYTPVSANDVHLNAAGVLALSDDIAQQLIDLQNGTVNPPVGGTGLVVSPLPPSTDLIADQLSGGIDSSIFTESANSNHARGQLFTLGDGAGDGFEITAITIRKSMNQTFEDDTLTLQIFEGSETDFSSGSGHTTAADGTDYFVGTSVTPIYSEDFEVDGLIAANDYVTLNLTTPVAVDELAELGFLLTLDTGASDTVSGRFRYLENSTGGRIAVSETAHSVSSRGVHFAVQGTETTNFLLGDVSLDGFVDFADISPFITLLSSGGFQDEADIDRNGAVDFVDISPFIALLSN